MKWTPYFATHTMLSESPKQGKKTFLSFQEAGELRKCANFLSVARRNFEILHEQSVHNHLELRAQLI